MSGVSNNRTFARWSSMRLGTQRTRLVDALGQEGDIIVVGQPNNAAEAIEQVTQTQP